MSNKKLIYCWNLNNPARINEISKNQSVDINRLNDYLIVDIKQNKSTPGIVVKQKFKSQCDKVYLLEVNALSSRECSAFLFAEDTSGESGNCKRLIENYTYVSADRTNQLSCAGWCCNYVSEV